MMPSFLITFREVIEASLIVATVAGILVKLGYSKSLRTVWGATFAAAVVSMILLMLASLVGVKAQEVYTGKVEEVIEGILMMLSAVFITWAVFFLHKYFGSYKVRLLQKVKSAIEQTHEHRGLFALVFTAVFREGFEIVLFLTTIYFSSSPASIFGGFAFGLVAGLFISFAFFNATLRMPVYWAFRASSMLLILFAAGLLARGAHEFMEAGLLPEIGSIVLPFIPTNNAFVADMIKAVFGLRQTMDWIQMFLYVSYVWVMHWWVFVRPNLHSRTQEV